MRLENKAVPKIILIAYRKNYLKIQIVLKTKIVKIL